MRKKIIVIVLAILVLILLGPSVSNQYVVPILMYHKVDKLESFKTKLAISPEIFEKQMAFLARNRYNVIALSDLVSLLKSKKEIHHNTVAITFDDAYESVYTKAFPVLKKYNLPATIFVITDFIGRPGYLSARQVKELSENELITLGSHTLAHHVLVDIESSSAIKEITKSKRALEKRIDKQVELFSYPLGAFNEDARRKVIRAGYTAAVATNPGKDYPDDDIYVLKRIRISESAANMFVFWVETSGYYTFIKEHRDD